MDNVLAIAYLLAWLLLVALLARLVFSTVAGYARSWTPKGLTLIAAEASYAATDVIVKPLRRVVPPLRIGGVTLDLTLMVALLAVYFATSLLR